MKKTALITGAASGIGRAFSDIFASEGYDLILVGRNLEKMETMKADYEAKSGIHVTAVQKDISKEGAAQGVYDEVKSIGLDVDVLINNAGVGDYGRFIDIPWEKERDLAGLDMLSVMQMTHLYAADMERRGGGRVLNMSSIAAFVPGPFMPMYYAAKAFVFSFSQAVSREMEGTGVTVTCLCPGPTATNFEKEANMGAGNKMFTWFRPSTADEVACEGYTALMKGDAVHVTKPRYRIFKFIARLGSEKAKRNLTAIINTGRIKRQNAAGSTTYPRYWKKSIL